MAVTAVPFTYVFSRAEYYSIAASLDPAMGHELVDGKVSALSPANPPHAGIVKFLNHGFKALDASRFITAVQDVLEIEPNGAPEPDVAIVTYRPDFYRDRHPNGGDALLVIEVGDTERNPRAKMRAYIADGRIASAWRIERSSRSLELWEPPHLEPIAILRGEQTIRFGDVDIVIDEIFAGRG